MTAEDKLINELKEISKTSKAELIRHIVPIEEWVDSPYYLGDICYTLYPKYKQHLKSIFDSERNEEDYIDEIIMKTSIGAGKTSFINVVLIRKLYELSCYSDIRPLYNLMTSKKLLMVYFSITKKVAEDTGYAQLRNMLLTIPYFRDNFLPNTKKSTDIEWPERNMAITSGSNANQVIGTDVIASVVDEGDFYGNTSATPDGQALSKAQSLYTSIKQRARSRFMVNGINHSLNCVLSSPTYESSFITKLINSSRGNPHTYIIEETLWTIKPKGTYSEIMFIVFKGTNLLDPQIVEDAKFFNELLISLYMNPIDIKGKTINEIYNELPEQIKQYFVEIPVDFYNDFKHDLLKALQDIGSVAIAPEGRLFSSNKFYNKALVEYNPLIQEEITITTNRMDERTIQAYFKSDYVPEHPELPRFIHFDQSTTGDEAGVACSYIETKINPDNTIDKKVTVEWMIRIKPPKKPEQIDLKKLRSIVYYLRDVLHLSIGKVTFDSYASEEAVQDLKIHNFNCSTLSVDRDDKAYQALVQLYYTESIKHPEHYRYHEELFSLIWYRAKRKVDHPATIGNDIIGDKGVTDAVCGSVYNALLDADVVYSNLRQEDAKSVLDIL